jgi:hypothetical protein
MNVDEILVRGFAALPEHQFLEESEDAPSLFVFLVVMTFGRILWARLSVALISPMRNIELIITVKGVRVLALIPIVDN